MRLRHPIILCSYHVIILRANVLVVFSLQHFVRFSCWSKPSISPLVVLLKALTTNIAQVHWLNAPRVSLISYFSYPLLDTTTRIIITCLNALLADWGFFLLEYTPHIVDQIGHGSSNWFLTSDLVHQIASSFLIKNVRISFSVIFSKMLIWLTSFGLVLWFIF